MGVYNCAGTLAQALDSLLAQTYQDFEVIMCDDGSADNTAEVATGYVRRFPHKFRLIHNERNMKLAATLNHCLEHVQTELVARMDGDDISLPDRFAKEVDFLDAHPEYGLVSSPMIYFDDMGDFRVGRGNGAVHKEDFRHGSPFCHAPVMVRTHIYRAVNGYTTGLKTERMEDYYLWYKIYKAGYKGYNLHEPLYKMRDDRNARGRRMSFGARWRGMKTDIEILRGLGLSRPLAYPFKHFVLGCLAQLLPYGVYKKLQAWYRR